MSRFSFGLVGIPDTGITVNAVGGSDFYATKAPAIIATNEAKGILSVWLKLSRATGSLIATDNFSITFNSSGGDSGSMSYFDFGGYSTGFSFFGFSTDEIVSLGTWNHILMSWDTNQSAGNKKRQFYCNGVSGAFPSVSDTDSAFSINTAGANPKIGKSPFVTLDGEIAELYLNLGEDIDLSIEANRLKFRSPGGRPIDLGSTGSLPTGTTPEIYLKNPAASWGTNSGSGGNFTVAGTISDVTPP